MKNYIKKLKTKDIEKLVNLAGYELAKDLEDIKTGEFLPPITKLDNKETGEYSLLIRCTKTEKPDELDLMLNKVLSGAPAMLMCALQSTGNYSQLYDNKRIIIISDFMFNELALDNKEKIAKNDEVFTTFMVNEFGNKYVDDYNEFVKKYNEDLAKAKEKETEEESDDELEC